MKKKIEKVLFALLSEKTSSKAILFQDLAAKFGYTVGGNLSNYTEELKSLLEELEENDFAHTEVLPNGNFRITRGVDFDSWSP